MRLISQVAKEIWICDNKTITPYRGDIMAFKMDIMNAHIGNDGEGNSRAKKLRGDASVKASDNKPKEKAAPPKAEPKLEVLKPKISSLPATIKENDTQKPAASDKKSSDPASDDSTATTVATGSSSMANGDTSAPKKYIPPHLRKKLLQ
jgi:ATP-binding cassette subfamily F protein 2